MPYGRTNVRVRRTNYRGSRFTRNVAAQKIGRAARVALARKTNKPIARIQRKRARPMTKVAKNTASVYVLSKQVRALQRAQIGLVQRHVLETNQSFVIPKETPAIFSLINFERGVSIIHRKRDEVQGSDVINNVSLATFNPSNNEMSDAIGSAEYDPFKFFKTQTDDVVPQDASYVPLSSTLLIQLSTSFGITAEMERWVLIMIIKQRPKSIQLTSNVHQYNLPDSSVGLINLASKDPFERMQFPIKHFQVLSKKWVKLTHNPVAETHTATKTFSMKFNYPHQYVNNDHSLAHSPATAGAIQDNFNQRIPIGQNVFCILSSSGDTAYYDVSCKIRKTDVWRDPHGNQ